MPPKEDVNAPDLYLPTMAFVTYMLVMGYALGAQDKFTPDVLGLAGSSGLAILLLEVFAIKLIFYLVQGLRIPLLDLCSCCGYKFLGVVITLAAKTTLGVYAGWFMLALTCLSIGTFMVKTLRSFSAQAEGFTPGFITEGIASPRQTDARKKQNYLLWGIGFLQAPWTWYLCYGV